MEKDVIIVIAEDDPGHISLIQKNLRRAGISNEIITFMDGESLLNYFFRENDGPHRKSGVPYLLLLDIRMPKIDGTEVLKRLKSHEILKKIPVIMVTTTDDPREVEKCHELGCSGYVTKPVVYDKFVEAIKQLGMFLKVVKIPRINGE